MTYTFSRLDVFCVRINSLIRTRVRDLHSRPLRSSRTSVGSPIASVPNLLAEVPVVTRNASTSDRIGSMKVGLASMPIGLRLTDKPCQADFHRPQPITKSPESVSRNLFGCSSLKT